MEEETKTPRQIKSIRRKLKLTRREFAERLGVSKRTVEGWELGVKPGRMAVRLMETLK